MKKLLFILVMICPALLLGQWDGGFNTARDYTVSGDWTFTGGVAMDVVVLDSITINYLSMQGSQAFDSLGSGDLSNNAYIDFSAADNNSAAIYWWYGDASNSHSTNGVLRCAKTAYIANLLINGQYRYIGLSASGPRVVWDVGDSYISLLTPGAHSIKIGDAGVAGEYTTFDSAGVATFPVGGVKITPGGVPASPVEGQFCVTSTGDSLGVYLASGWKWFIAGE